MFLHLAVMHVLRCGVMRCRFVYDDLFVMFKYGGTSLCFAILGQWTYGLYCMVCCLVCCTV